MAPCTCGQPGCINCLIQSTLPSRDTKGPDLPDELLDGVILVVRRPSHLDETTDLKMQQTLEMLRPLSNQLNLLGLISSISVRKSRDTK